MSANDEDTVLHILHLIHEVSDLVPVPLLKSAVQLAEDIYKAVRKIKNNRLQLLALVNTIAAYLHPLARLSSAEIRGSERNIDTLIDALTSIKSVCLLTVDAGLIKRVLKKDDNSKTIEKLHQKILEAFRNFNVISQVQMRGRIEEMHFIKQQEHANMEALMQGMTDNFALFEEKAELRHENMMTLMVSFQRELAESRSPGVQQEFLKRTIATLQRRTSNLQPPPQWTVTSLEITRGPRIGAGGYSDVFKGKWRGQVVAIKQFRGHIDEKMLEREANLWYNLRGNHIVPMFAASIYDRPPFMIMPFMANGTILQYLARNPQANRLKLINDVAAGLQSLHSFHVAHGDLKADNILIDDAGSAMLCDFGLSAIKRDIRTRTADLEISSRGSLRWASPERILRGRLTFQGDVYAFGITIWEIYTGDVPFGYMDDSFLRDHIARANGRPEPRPAMSNNLWTLTQACWRELEGERPTLDIIRQHLEVFLSASVTSVNNPSATSGIVSNLPITNTNSILDLPHLPAKRTYVTNTNRLNPVQNRPLTSPDSRPLHRYTNEAFYRGGHATR